MPYFIYKARDSTQKLVEGTVEADSETAAITRLGAAGVFPLTIRSADAPAHASPLPSFGGARRIPNRALAHLSRQLADLLGGGLPLFNALALLSEQTEHRTLRAVIDRTADAVREGQAFSDALARHPEVFSPLYINMIRAGEAGGALDAVLGRLADLLEADSEFRGRITSALVYPSIILFVGAITVLVLLVYVVPKLTSVFTESGQALPLPTRILLSISHTLSDWWWVWIGSLAVTIWSFRRFRRSGAGHAVTDRFILSLPLAGTLVRKMQTARFARNLGVMVGQGVAMLQALEVASSTVSSVPLREAVESLRDSVQSGQSLSESLRTTGMFPPFVSNLVAVGEESGTLETALLKIASSYERESDRALGLLATALEPLLIVVVGLVVMFIVISVLLPIFELGLVAQ